MSDLLGAVQDECGQFVTRYVIVAETVSDHDMRERSLHVISGDGLGNGGPTSWDLIGLLRYAQMICENDEVADE